MRDYGGFGEPGSAKTALLIEMRSALGAPRRGSCHRCDAALSDRGGQRSGPTMWRQSAAPISMRTLGSASSK